MAQNPTTSWWSPQKDAACILDERGYTDTLSNFAAEENVASLVSSAAAWPCLELGDAVGLTDTYSGEVKPGSLLKLVEQVCQELDIGFRVRFDQPKAKLLFELFRPNSTRRPVCAAVRQPDRPDLYREHHGL